MTASRHDPRRYTQAAREAFAASFEARVLEDAAALDHEPPTGAELARRAEAARRAHYLRLSALGVAARRQRAA